MANELPGQSPIQRKNKFKSSGIQTDDPNLRKNIEVPPVGIKTPIDMGTGRSGIFQMSYSSAQQVADNLKNLISTNYGERVGNYYYGANLRPLTTELTSQDDFDGEAMLRIQSAVRNFMPYVELETFNSNFDLSIVPSPEYAGIAAVTLTVKYSVPQLRISGKGLEVTLYCIG